MQEYIFIITGLAIMLVLFLLIKFSKKFRKDVYEAFLFAEHEVLKGRKMDYVVGQIYYSLPSVMRIIPKSTYKKILQKMFDEIKDLLDDGKINKSSKVVK